MRAAFGEGDPISELTVRGGMCNAAHSTVSWTWHPWNCVSPLGDFAIQVRNPPALLYDFSGVKTFVDQKMLGWSTPEFDQYIGT